jgi:hypothetical protein
LQNEKGAFMQRFAGLEAAAVLGRLDLPGRAGCALAVADNEADNFSRSLAQPLENPASVASVHLDLRQAGPRIFVDEASDQLIRSIA